MIQKIKEEMTDGRLRTCRTRTEGNLRKGRATDDDDAFGENKEPGHSSRPGQVATALSSWRYAVRGKGRNKNSKERIIREEKGGGGDLKPPLLVEQSNSRRNSEV